MAQGCPRSAGIGKPLRLVDCGGDRREPTSAVITGTGIAVVEQFDRRMP
jgi:hypothetical protein